MRYAIWCDPHFGDGGPADDSGSDALKLRLRENAGADVNIWAGDVLEFDQFRWQKIFKVHKDIIYRIRREDEFIDGNHDKHFWGRDRYEITLADGRKGCVVHGHTDKMLFPPLKLLVHALKYVEWLIPKIDNPEQYSIDVTEGTRAKTKDAARKLAELYGYTFVICGHTHERPVIERVELSSGRAILYANGGTLQHDRAEYITLDSETMRVALHNGPMEYEVAI